MKKYKKVILLTDTSSSYVRGILRGFAKYSRLRGSWIFYHSEGRPKDVLSQVNDWDPDGLIFHLRSARSVQGLLPKNIPSIAISWKSVVPDIPNIYGNWEADSKMAAEYFIGRSFENFGFCGFSDMFWSQDRQKYFLSYLQESGFINTSSYSSKYFQLNTKWRLELHKLVNWLKSLPKPVGIFCCCDIRGRHIVEACKVGGYAIPEDVSVLGIDNDDVVCELTSPMLSSITVGNTKGGYKAGELLDLLMQGNKWNKEDIIIDPLQVITRESTDIIAVEDPIVQKAVMFIRENVKNAIQVQDVAESVYLSRRVLERKFRSILHHSILQEIRKTRVKHICKMLIELEMPITQIANELQFNSHNHMRQYFQKEMGIGPSAFRKKYKV